MLSKHATKTILRSCLGIGVLYGSYAYYIFRLWEKNYPGKRLGKDESASPSNKEPPDIKSWKENKEKTLENSRRHKNFDTCELLHDLADLVKVKKRNNLLRQSMVLDPSKYVEKNKELDMDHVYVDYPNFLWAHVFIGPSSYFLWKSGVTWLRARKFLVKYGVLKVKPLDIDQLIGKLCLEQTQAIHYYAKTKKDSKIGNIGGFFFAEFPYIDENSEYKVADLLVVDIDMDTHRFVKAKMDDMHLTASETLILLWFNTIAAQHVKLHSYANWGVNLDDNVKEINPFLHRNSVVTTMYNYFGYTCFATFMEEWERQGLLKLGFDPNSLIDCFNHGIKGNIWQHPMITDLVQHSRFVAFIVKVRAIFFIEFAKYKDMFPGVNPEAMFIGTILHSLGHTLMDWNSEDPLWL